MELRVWATRGALLDAVFNVSFVKAVVEFLCHRINCLFLLTKCFRGLNYETKPDLNQDLHCA